jgi:SOS-response transcriptional repressor LexA
MDLNLYLQPLPPTTRIQEECLKVIFKFVQDYRRYPTLREMSSLMAMSGVKAVISHSVIRGLEVKGYLQRNEPKRRRNIRLTNLALKKLNINPAILATFPQ